MKTTLLCLSCVLSLVCSMSRSTAATADNPPSLDVTMFAGVTIQGTIGKSYSLMFAPSLDSSSLWQKLDTVVLTNAVQIWIDFDSPKAGKRFYRTEEVGSTPASPAGFVWIKPGTFMMGSPDNSDEGPQTQVTISHGFWMGKYEVTQAEYQAVVGSNPSYFRNGIDGKNNGGTGSTITNELLHPVEGVSWNDATNYCALRTQQERAAGLILKNYLYRLPTESEWEYACRAGTTTAFYLGSSLHSGQANFHGQSEYDALLGTVKNTNGIYLGITTPVGSYAPNPWGLYDMIGNVFEWCQDWYDVYPGGSVFDPQGPASGSLRVIRGGGWYSDAWYCRSAIRSYYCAPGDRCGLIGFRVVLAPGQ